MDLLENGISVKKVKVARYSITIFHNLKINSAKENYCRPTKWNKEGVNEPFGWEAKIFLINFSLYPADKKMRFI